MKRLTLKIRDDYFDKVVSFLEILPKRAVQIKQDDKKKEKLDAIENTLVGSFEDIKHGRTRKIGTII